MNTKAVYFIAFALLVTAGFLQLESVSDGILGILLLIMSIGALCILRYDGTQSSIAGSLNIAMPIMNKFSLTKQKNISVIIGAKNSGKSSILKNNNYTLIPENKLNGPRVGSWWQQKNELFFEVDVDQDFEPDLPSENDQGWEALFNKLQKQLLPYQKVKSVVIVFPIQILHRSAAPIQEYLSNAKKLLQALNSYSSDTKLNVIFSHCEKVQGFQSFFYGLENSSKSQLLTVAKGQKENKLSLANMFTAKFTNIIESLQQQMFSRLRQEHDLAKKIEIKDFPLQLEALIKPIKELLVTIEITSPNQTAGIYFCSNASSNSTYDFVQNSDPISTAKQQIVLLSNKASHHSYFNSNIITNINNTLYSKSYDKKEFLTTGILTIISIASIIIFKQSYNDYNTTNNITNTVESMIAVKANNNNSEIDRLYLALKYLSDNKNSNLQTEELRGRLKEHYAQQLSSTLTKEIANKVNQYFASKLDHNENLFSSYINTKLVFTNKTTTQKQEWLQHLLTRDSHHKYLNDHIANLFKTTGDSIEFPTDIQTKVAQKLNGFTTADKVMMLVNKPVNRASSHMGFPDETILSNKHIKSVITEQIPSACEKLVMSKELPEQEKQICIHASIKHYLVEYMNFWQYQNTPPQVRNHDGLAQLNASLTDLLKSKDHLKDSIMETQVAMNTLNDYRDPELKKDIASYNESIKNAEAWAKLLSDTALNQTLNNIVKIKPDYEKYYTATVQYYNKDPLSQIIKLEQIAAAQAPEQREWLNSIADTTLKFYEQKAYTYLDNIWQQTVYTMYQKKIANKFPINPNSDLEMSISDFEQFFSADGILQTYISLIEPLINSPIISSTNKESFFLSRKIANSWFINNKLALKMTMIPIDLTTNATNFYLDIGNNKMVFDKNNLKSTTISWPKSGDDLVTMEFTNKSGQSTITNKNSPWALLKLLQEADIKPLIAKNQSYVTFKKDAFAAQYQTITDDGFSLKDINTLAQFNITDHL